MRKLLQRIMDNPIAVFLLVVTAVWGGAFALLHLPVGLFPGLDVPVVNIVSHLPGAGAEDMELLVTRPIEDRIRTIPGLRRVSSTTIEGVSQVTAEFAWGLRLADARQRVQAELAAVQGDLPVGVRPSLENIGTTLQEVAGYVVYGAGSPIELRTAVQTELVSRLMGVDGVARVEVLGGDEPAYVVRLRPEALARHHLMVGDVTAALARYNQVVAADFIDRGAREYLIRGDSRLQTRDDILAVPVVADGPRSVLVKDVATVRAGRVPRHYQVHGNGRPAVAFIVSKRAAASTIAVVQGIDQELAGLQSLLPKGSQVRKFYDQADLIGEARDDLFHDLLFGALLAAAVLFVFMGTWRATLIVTATIPIVLLGTLGLMEVFGQTLNVITLSALTLAVGMVVDDAIVVAECVVRHLQTGTDRRTASLNGAAEIAGPDASGTFTTVAAFAPLLFLGGIAGLFVRPFGLVVSMALLASLLVSLTLVPLAFGRIGITGHRNPLGARLLAQLDRALQKILAVAFAHRGGVILAAALLLGLGGLAAFLGPISVLPPIDEGAILIEYVLPPGTSLAESNRIGDLLERQALAQTAVATVYRRTGSPQRGFQIEGVNRGELTIKLQPRRKRTATVAQIMAKLRREYGKIPGVVFLYHQPTQEKMDESLSGLPALFGVTIFGSDMNRLIALAAQAERQMAGDPGVANIVNNTRIKIPQIIVRPDPVELARCGLSPEAVFAAIRAARFGVPATTIVRQRQQVQVLVRTDAAAAATLDGLTGLLIPTPSGQVVPLRQVAAGAHRASGRGGDPPQRPTRGHPSGRGGRQHPRGRGTAAPEVFRALSAGRLQHRLHRPVPGAAANRPGFRPDRPRRGPADLPDHGHAVPFLAPAPDRPGDHPHRPGGSDRAVGHHPGRPRYLGGDGRPDPGGDRRQQRHRPARLCESPGGRRPGGRRRSTGGCFRAPAAHRDDGRDHDLRHAPGCAQPGGRLADLPTLRHHRHRRTPLGDRRYPRSGPGAQELSAPSAWQTLIFPPPDSPSPSAANRRFLPPVCGRVQPSRDYRPFNSRAGIFL